MTPCGLSWLTYLPSSQATTGMKVSLAQKKRGDRKGPQPVYIRLSHLGKEAFVSLGIAVHPRVGVPWSG